ncbi:MAG: glycosyltransferase family 2 protein [Patescibacteria group bacterium]
MKQENKISVSIIIPSFNEGDDVRLSIESALGQTHPPKEILVVDDSKDETPHIIGEYASQGVKLLRGPGKGCCEARNMGMEVATGDVIMLLNADVVLPEDFISRIAKHYEKGADYVLVESKVFNTDYLLARFVEAQHHVEHDNRTDLEWTEGFSCKRSAAQAIGFIPGNFPVRFCRDWFLGKTLHEKGFRKVIDRTIVVTHKAPEIFGEYWNVRSTRGRFAVLAQRYLLHRSRTHVFLKLVAKHAILAVLLATLVYPLQFVVRAARKSDRGMRDVFPFFAAFVIQEVARAYGEWRGWML